MDGNTDSLFLKLWCWTRHLCVRISACSITILNHLLTPYEYYFTSENISTSEWSVYCWNRAVTGRGSIIIINWILGRKQTMPIINQEHNYIPTQSSNPFSSYSKPHTPTYYLFLKHTDGYECEIMLGVLSRVLCDKFLSLLAGFVMPC